jgi:feruloyl esterase
MSKSFTFIKSTAWRWIVAPSVAVTLISIAGVAPSFAADPQTSCSDLSGYSDAGVQIASAEPKTAGAQPPHCKITGAIEGNIRFELLLPDEWNGRFLMGGGGGFVGSVQNSAQSPLIGPKTALQLGYATVGTDTGHQAPGIDASWALDNEKVELDFGYRAVHLTAETAKKMIGHYYGRPSEYDYFIGCSRGGGQAMMESQRYPEDFDGIVAAAPAYNWPAVGAAFLQTQQAMFPDASDVSSPVLTDASRKLVAETVLASCDAADGVEDGLLGDPRACSFDPASLRCSGAAAADCLTDAQIKAFQSVYGGPIIDGERFFPGFPVGGEDQAASWGTWVVGRENALGPGTPNLHFAFSTQMFKYLIYDDPSFDYSSYEFENFTEETARAHEVLSAVDTDLGDFAAAGGKMIFWHGWADPALSALATIDYYEAVEAGDASVRDYSRLFLLPGVFHCSGGPGPDGVDWIGAISDWVEKGEAPQTLVASRPERNGRSALSRPICAYPQVAVYSGSGSTDDASNWECGEAR